jgi:glycosyltransferase involved in cell wall biosynthesis
LFSTATGLMMNHNQPPMFDKKKDTNQNHCMIVHAYYPLGETRVEREALALVDAGYHVDVICLRDKAEETFETIEGVDIFRLPVSRRKKGGLFGQFFEYLNFFFLVFLKLLPLFRRRKYGTIQVHNLPDFLIFSAIIPKLLGSRLILDLHDLMPEFFAYKTKKPMSSFLVRMVVFQEQISCRFADHIITVTDVWRERLISRGVQADKVSVVMNVADDRIFQPSDDLFNPQRPGNGFRLIYHGAFKKHYGMEDLINAIRVAREAIPDIHLTLQGVGDFYPQMVQLVNEMGLDEQVQINHYSIHAQELPSLIMQSDVGVVPNHNDVFTGDLLPTKMLEYVALNTPVLASRTRVISKYFDDDMVQFFLPGDPKSLAENIVYLYHQKDRLCEKILNAKKFIEDYSWQSISRDYVKLVGNLSGNSFWSNED